jgi:putative membrane protein
MTDDKKPKHSSAQDEKSAADILAQQIMFGDNKPEAQPSLQNAVAGEDPLAKQVILEPDSKWLPQHEAEEQFAEELLVTPPPKSGRFFSMKLTLLSALGALTAIELYQFFSTGFSDSPVITSLWAVVVVALTGMGGRLAYKELHSLKHLKQQQHMADQALAILSTEGLSCDLQLELESFERWQDEKNYSPQEYLQLYSQTVLNKVDQQAVAQISRSAAEAVVFVAISPVAIIDMLALLWRNLAMIDKLAGLYGVRLGYYSRIRLIKDVLKNMVYAGASEIITDVGLDLLGAEVMTKVSGRFAQGLGAGVLTARLGLKVVYLCRPLPVQDNKQLSLKKVKGQFLAQVKALLMQNG